MTQDVGKGFARRVTQSNLGIYAPLLRDRTKDLNLQPSEETGPARTTPGIIPDELAAAQALFGGTRVRVQLPLTFPSGRARRQSEIGPTHEPAGAVDGQANAVADYANPVLLAEIPGPGRWSQAAFSKEVFTDFFGAGWIDLTHMDLNGTVTRAPRVDPIVKQSSNYCYELSAASGRAYPEPGSGRPIAVFMRLQPHRFEYRLVMPSDTEHATLDSFLATHCAVTPPHRMRRLITDLQTLLRAWPQAPFTLVATESSN